MSRKALGRGLEALIPSTPAPSRPAFPPESPSAGVEMVPLDQIHPNPFQPRTVMDPDALQELADSIRQNGLLQPLVVRRSGKERLELIAGERRLLACRQAELETVPVVVKQVSQREMLELALVENLQREDLNAMEEAEAYQRLGAEFGLTQEEIATRVGKSRVAVTNSLRLLGLEDDLKEMVSRGTLSAGHARALLAVPGAGARRRLAKEILDRGLSVRQAEARARGQKRNSGRAKARKRSHPALEEWENRLRTRFGTQVQIVGGVGRGKVVIHYFSGEDLERILDLTGVNAML